MYSAQRLMESLKAKNPAKEMDEIISHEGGKWLVKSKSGKVLGTHDTKEKALAQLAAVEISKHGG